ncbi:MAG: glycosyl transferase [Anaerolineaceae bacterium]|nr:glycosyl transferase [Anaerolineaceae bacterium]
MRVVIFTETFLPKLDGIVSVVCLLLDHLVEHGVEPIVVAPRLGDGIDEYNGVRVISVNGMTLPLYPELRVGPPGYNTYKELKAFQPDVAHFIHPVMVGIPGMIMAKRLGIPTLASFHLDLARLAQHYNLSFMTPVTDILTKLIFNWADYSLAPSNAVLQYMQSIGVNDVGLWKRGVDAEKFNPSHKNAAMRHQLSDGHPDAPLLLYVGRLSQEKQVDKLKTVVDRLPHVRLAIVGDGPERENLEAHFAGTNTKFMGYMKGEALSQAYASSDVFVFPSALETFGLVVVEAMAAGLPVVATRVGGIPDVVDEGVTGYTFNIGDTESLIDRVQRVISSPQTLQRMGLSARTYAETQSWPTMMDEVIEHYARLIAENRYHVASA